MGETKMRFGKVTPRSVSGSNRPGIRLLFHRENSSPRQMVCMRNVRETDTRLFGILECHRSHSGRRIDRRYRVSRVRRILRRFVRGHFAAAFAVLMVWLVAGVSVAVAQQSGTEPARRGQRQPPPQFNLPGSPDPPAPVAPDVIVRGDNGRVVVRATKLAAPLAIDGVLDEPIYRELKPISDFIQTVPNEGELATERTEAWITYDENYIYLSCRCWDSAPPEEWTANELRRDTNQLRQNDMFGALLDTFHDRRNGFNFYTNPLGGSPTRSSPTKGIRTPTGTRCGRCAPAASKVDGRWRWRFRSSRSATCRVTTRSGASSFAARSAARTSGRT